MIADSPNTMVYNRFNGNFTRYYGESVAWSCILNTKYSVDNFTYTWFKVSCIWLVRINVCNNLFIFRTTYKFGHTLEINVIHLNIICLRSKFLESHTKMKETIHVLLPMYIISLVT